MYDVITIGKASQDVFLITDDASGEIVDVHFDVGGSGVNAATTLASLGFKSGLIARVGKDTSGDTIVKVLKKHKVIQDLIIRDTRIKTAFSVTNISDTKAVQKQVFAGYDCDFKIADIPLTKLKTKWLHVADLGGDIRLLDRVATSATKKKIKLSLVLNNELASFGLKRLLPIFRNLEVLVLDLDQAKMLLGQEHDGVRELFNDISVATPGVISIIDKTRGAYLAPGVAVAGAVHFAPWLRQTRDLTGAQDAYAASLVASIAKDKKAEAALQLAVLEYDSVAQEIGGLQGQLKRFPETLKLNKVRVTQI